jgi:phosphoglycolate phosphatase-like HAD superfamily hydrolase/ribosomal protein S18 acetylase RimI-like enzyme
MTGAVQVKCNRSRFNDLTAMHLVLFDIDGTLTLTNQVDNRCYLCALGEALGGKEIDADWTKYPHVTDSGIASALLEAHYGAPSSAEQLDAVRGRFVALLEEAFARDPAVCRPVPGAAAMLAALTEHPGFAVGLATGGWRESARLKLRQAGLGEWDIPLASASDARAREAIMTLAAERVAAHRGVSSFQSIVYVGDGLWDVRAARNLGYHFIGIAGAGSPERLRAEGARCVIADYSDQAAFFAALAGFSGQGAAKTGASVNRARALSIRRALASDAEQILDCLQRAFQPFRGDYTDAAFQDTVLTPDTFHERRAAMTVFVASTEDGAIVGTIACEVRENGEGHIRGMAVRPEWQGCGVAQSLLEAAESELRQRRCSRMSLDTTLPLQRAVRFYERNGFRASGVVTDFFGMPLFEYVKTIG